MDGFDVLVIFFVFDIAPRLYASRLLADWRAARARRREEERHDIQTFASPGENRGGKRCSDGAQR